jgi:hypothetical protein
MALMHVAVLAIVVVAGSGCGSTVGGEAAPLVLETGAPSDPPRVGLVVHAGAGERTLPGVLYTTDWSTRIVGATDTTRVPVPWPRRSSIDRGHDPAIALGTRAAPDFVTVKTYSRVARATGVPIGGAVATFECSRFTRPTCKVATTNAGLRIRGLGRGILAGHYLTVFCTWHVPMAANGTVATPRDDVSASWLFQIDGPRRLEASRP